MEKKVIPPSAFRAEPTGKSRKDAPLGAGGIEKQRDHETSRDRKLGIKSVHKTTLRQRLGRAGKDHRSPKVSKDIGQKKMGKKNS